MKYLRILNNSNASVVLEGPSICYYPSNETLTLIDQSNASSGYGLMTEFTGTKTYASYEAASELNYCSAIGALLWEAADGSLLVSNGDGQEWDPKSDTVTTPTKSGYILKGVCVGRGLWAVIGWAGLTATKKWASSNSDVLYTSCHGANIHGNGWESTQHIRTAHADANISGTIWENLGANMFIPSKYELEEIQNNTCDNNHAKPDGTDTEGHTYNKNIGKLLSLDATNYWSSSQYSNGSSNYRDAFSFYFRNGDVSYSYKTNESRSVACLHFGA